MEGITVAHRTGAGLTAAVVAAASFGTSGSFAASLLAVGWTSGSAVTYRVVLAALALTVPALLLLRRTDSWGALRRGAGPLALYGLVAVAGCQLAFFQAVQRLSVGVALLLEYSGVLLVVLWMWLRHRHVPTRLTIAGGLLALLGLGLVLDVLGDSRLDPVGVAWGLLAAVGLAVFFVLSAGDPDGEDAELPPLVVAWAGLALGGAGLLLAGLLGVVELAAPRVDVTLVGRETSWVVPVLGLSLLAAAFAYLAGIRAARLLGARLSSFAGLTEVLFAVLFAWVLLDEVPSGVQLAGGVLVLAGIALVRLGEPAPQARLDPEPVPLPVG